MLNMLKSAKQFLILCSVIFTGFSAMGQKWEVGGMLGASNYNGDLAREIVLKESHLAGGVFFRHNLGNKYAALRKQRCCWY